MRRPLLDVSLWLAKSPMSPLRMKSPDDATRKLFADPFQVVDDPDERMLNRNLVLGFVAYGEPVHAGVAIDEVGRHILIVTLYRPDPVSEVITAPT